MMYKTVKIILAVFVVLGVGTFVTRRWPGARHQRTAMRAVHGHGAGHGHAHGAGDAVQVTVWTDRCEAFVEYPPPVAGSPAEFVIHVSHLQSGSPRLTGPMTMVMRKGAGASVEHEEPAPARDGIYLPMLTFSSPGTWQCTVLIPQDDGVHSIRLPDVTVYATEEDALHAPPQGKVEGFSFLKETQWKLGTITQIVPPATQDGAPSLIPRSAVIDDAAAPYVYVQHGGENFERRPVTVAAHDDTQVAVLRGLAAGERIIVKGLPPQDIPSGPDASHHDDHAGHDHDGLVLDDATLKKFDIQVARAGAGHLDVRVNVPGEITFDENRLAHIVPGVSGIVREVLKNGGDTVTAGDIVAWIESARLGEEKIAYLSRWSEFAIGAMELERARQVRDHSLALIHSLEASPGLETLRAMHADAMGENRRLLVSGYAELTYSTDAYQREKGLFDKRISSKESLQRAEARLKQAEATYAATVDSIRYEVQWNLHDAMHRQRMRDMELQRAVQRLYVHGLTEQDVAQLDAYAQQRTAHVTKSPDAPAPASEPRAPDVNLARHPLRAPFDGVVIARHITLGEMLKEDTKVFVIADLRTVWANLRLSRSKAANVRQGCRAAILLEHENARFEGAVQSLEPVLDRHTRAVCARVVLDNTEGLIRPGMYITAQLFIEQVEARIVIPEDAVQYIDDAPCVMIATPAGFAAQEVTLGRTDGTHVEVVSGLAAGTPYVVKHAFRVKAELARQRRGAVSDHGHEH